ncbi:MAG: PAS domain S-box protein [Planctomycetota bacterium]|nr:PAS domain S-box protein [Planctomycetota bacterium]
MTTKDELGLSELNEASGPILEYVFTRSALGMCVVDTDFRYRFLNDSMCSMLGHERDELIGRTFLEVTHPEDRELDQELAGRVFRGEIPDYRIRKRFVRKDGSVVTGDLQATVIRDESGNVAWGLATIDNVTERDKLLTKVANFERNATLNSMAANIAHDLGNLLTIVKTRTEELAVGADGQKVAQIQDALARAESLTRGLLSFTRQRVRARRPVDLDQLALHFAGFAESLAPDRVRLHVEAASEGARVLIDPIDLERVLMNLVVNACDAMPDGGILHLSTRQTTRDEKADGFVAITLTDEGVGIPIEIRDRIFDPFFSTKGEGGSGVGLAIVKEIIESNGGFVRVDSRPGAGTAFHLVLPHAPAVDA